MEFASKKGIRTRLKMGQMYDYVDFASVLWPENGPYILIEQVGSTSVWVALNVPMSSFDTIVPGDTHLYYRIA